MDVAAIASTATGMKQAQFQQQVGVAVAKKAMDMTKQAGADLTLLLGSVAPAGRGASPPGVGQNVDLLA